MKNTAGILLLVLGLATGVAMADAPMAGGSPDACINLPDSRTSHLQLVPEGWVTGGRRRPEEYRQRIEQIESEEGVFSYSLVPELIALGLAGQEQGGNAESARVFERALYIVRVNDGLYSARQLALLDLIIDANSARKKWKKVADTYDMMHWLYRRIYGKGDPRQLPTLKRLRRWYMESYNKDTGRSLEDLFSHSERIYEQAIRIMWECTGGDEQRTMCFWHRACCPDAKGAPGICPLDND